MAQRYCTAWLQSLHSSLSDVTHLLPTQLTTFLRLTPILRVDAELEHAASSTRTDEDDYCMLQYICNIL